METPHMEHLAALKHRLWFSAGTTNLVCHLQRKIDGQVVLYWYSDSDLGGDIDDRKSTTEALFIFEQNLISWQSQKQKVVALSSCEAEYIAANVALCQRILPASLLGDIRGEEGKNFVLKVDNKSVISLYKNSVFHDKSKHIDLWYHFIRICVEDGRISNEYVNAEDQLLDILRKPLGNIKFQDLCTKIGIIEILK